MLRAASGVIVVALASSAMGATIMIDSFESPFESEEFISSAGATINSTYFRAGLEVGNVNLTNGASVGDPWLGSTPRGQETQSQVGLAGVLGGARVGDLTADGAGPYGSQVSVNTFTGWPGPTDSGMAFSTAFGTQAVGTLTYGADTPLGANLGVLIDGAFEIDLISSDMFNASWMRHVTATVELVSGAGSASETTRSVSQDLSEEKLYTFAFDAFAGIDFSDVDRIVLSFDQTHPDSEAVDFAIGPFRATGRDIPTPGSGVLIAIGLVGAGRRRR